MKHIATVMLCMIGLIGASAEAGVQDCREAISNFRTARTDLMDALKAYASCVASSDGRDDCSSEFAAIHSAQDDFEEAVSTYQSECP
jgi:oligoendopeptidase F